MQNQLLEIIEDLRQQMYIKARGKKLTDSDVLEISQQIDRLLNQHQLMGCLWQREDRKVV
jgi:hypothetical protein